MLAVLILGIVMNLVALPLAARRVVYLYREISSGKPAPDRIAMVRERIGRTIKRQGVEVLGQRKMLTWTIPGAAHFFVMWAFFILATVYLEAYGSLIKLLLHGGSLPEGVALSWAIPFVGHWAVLGFLQDFIAVMALIGIITFVVIRVKNAPKDLGRKSRFFGSHLGPAWFTLFMIFNVIWTLFLFRGASAALHTFQYKDGAFGSIGVGALLDGLPHGALEAIEGVGLLLHVGVMLVFLVFVLNSKHLHIFVAPLNVMFGRYPIALGAAKPMTDADGKPITLEDLEDLDEEATLGVGAVEQFSWKGILDFNTCTECGRCQSQCPAWNTEKPLSPKLMIMALRDATAAKAPYLMADEKKREALVAGEADGGGTLTKELERPLVGDTGDDWFYMPENGSGVIDPDVLWSCVTCGACVQQCPVDIEHVDHIVDMRRYQVLVESNFPAELNGLFKGMEGKGNPWNMSASARMDWAKDLPFDVKVVGEDVESLDEVDWLFWVGCAGAYEDRAKKTTRAVAELLDMAGVSFAVLGNGETCTGDSARRAGNEFVFQGLATQNVETFNEYKVKKVVSTCAHCFNTLKNEYKDLGVELEVVHHTQLLNRLVREKKLTPVASQGGTRSVTYHDPCYIGRHNQVYEPPRDLLTVIPDADFVEMPRNKERSFCCGAGGARMWMEEKIGTRINDTRTAEAVATGADQIAVGCPFCRVMLSDGLTSAQSKGEAREEVEVLDVAQMLLASVKGEAPKKATAPADSTKPAAKAGANGAAAARADAPADATAEDTKDEPEAGDATQTDETVTDTADAGPAAKSSGGSSLFDVEDDEPSSDERPAAKAGSGGSLFDVEEDAPAEEPAAKAGSGGSLFDVEDDEPSSDEQPAAKAGSGGSLFDVEEDTDEADEPAATESTSESEAGSSSESKSAEPATADLGSGGSLFDIEEDADEADDADGADGPAATETKAGEDAAGDATTDADTDRAEDAADTDVEPEQPAASSGTTNIPATTIPEGGSLFDIESTEEEAPAASSDTTEKAGEDAAADSTTDADVDRADDAADTDVEPESDAAEAEPEPEPAEAPKASAPSAGTEEPAKTSFSGGGSLFDIAAPTAATGSAGASSQSEVEAEPQVEAETEPELEPEASDAAASDEAEQPTEGPASTAQADEGDEAPIRSLRDIKAGASSTPAATTSEPAGSESTDGADDEADSEPEPDSEATEAEEPEGGEPDADVEPAAQDKPAKPAASGEAHQPKTDVEIGEGGSLFDL